MSIQLQDLEYLKYIEPHLASEIFEFTLKNHKGDENLSKMFKEFISKSQNFEKIKEYKIYLWFDWLYGWSTKGLKKIQKVSDFFESFLFCLEKTIFDAWAYWITTG